MIDQPYGHLAIGHVPAAVDGGCLSRPAHPTEASRRTPYAARPSGSLDGACHRVKQQWDEAPLLQGLLGP
ncbi:MAG: hypothetical protein QOK36_3333 [Gaiellales bacterium]|nr:hypothetical protein [Gaiellales bacterium]